MDKKLIERIQKLLALADPDGGATESEANLAMEKAQQIMADNNLSMAMIEAAGGKSEGRVKEEEQGQAMYGYQRNLMETICQVNYCYMSVIYKAAKSKSLYSRHRTVPAGYRIIGRESNVASCRVMFDYLIKTINRLVLQELGGDHRQRMSRWAMSWCDGCSERLVTRINKRHTEMLLKQKREAEAKRKEQEVRTQHSGATGNAIIVVLMDHAQAEMDLNHDFRHGWKPGTTARRRAEENAAKAKRKAEAIAAGVTDKDVLWYIEHGYTREQAEKIVHPENFETPEEREKRKKKEERQNRSWEKQWAREHRKRNWDGYLAGQTAGDNISFDQQIDNQTSKRLK